MEALLLMCMEAMLLLSHLAAIHGYRTCVLWANSAGRKRDMKELVGEVSVRMSEGLNHAPWAERRPD